MARKVFISFLGTNNYVPCRYIIDGIISEPVRFVQEALVEHTCRNWQETDIILVFCTCNDSIGEKGAKEINWFDNGQARINDETEKIGLQHRLSDLKEKSGLKPLIEQVDIKAGFSEEEIWDIFNTVYSKLQPNDEIYFDVTHAFRSIPLFSIVLFNYTKFMMGTKLVSIMYGAFEKLGTVNNVREIPAEERLAPVVDLTDIALLQEYNQIASNLKSFGKVAKLKDAISSELIISSDNTIRDLGNSISELDEFIATIDLKEIKCGKFIQKFRATYKNVRKRKNLAKPIRELLDELNKETEDFVSENSFRNIEAAINWTIKHDMLMQAYPLAEEYVILRLTEKFEELKPSQLSMKKFRIIISSLLGMPNEDFEAKNWKDALAQFPEVADDISDDRLIREIRPLYSPIRKARNSLAHGKGSIKYAALKAGIPNIINCIRYLNSEYEHYSSSIYLQTLLNGTT